MKNSSDQKEVARPQEIIWPRAILHLDMDAFFVNVYLLDHPEDNGIPLAVGGQPDSRGVIASASYEARKFGIRSAMPSITAVKLCPNLKIVRPEWSRIQENSHSVIAILKECGPVEKISVDEAFVDLSELPEPESLAKSLQVRVKEETQLPASVGLATSKLVAKIASDFEKPEGCTIVQPGNEAEFLAPLPVRVIWGIGPRTAEKLAKMKIFNCAELAAFNPYELRGAFGQYADQMQRMASGIDRRRLHIERGNPKSISHEWTFSQDVNDREQLLAQLQKQSISVSKSLRKRNLVAHTVRVKFRWSNFTTFTRQRSFEIGVDDAERIFNLAVLIWEENWPPGKKMRLLGLGVSGLEEPAARQTDFGF